MPKTKNMTEGSPFRHLILFSLPLMVGSIFQEFYTIADTAIVGRSLGVSALAALGAVAWPAWLFQGIIQGITQGFSILVAQKFGAGKMDEMRKAAANAILLSAVSAALLFVMSEASIFPFLRLIRMPFKIQRMGSQYLQILFSGLPVVVAYNMLAAILRALGDSRDPLYAMILASCVNIGLDILFVVYLDWGVMGAAGATVLAQLVSVLFCLIRIRTIHVLRFSGSDFYPQPFIIRRMVVLALPMAFQNLVIAAGGIIVQNVVNRYSIPFIAGYTTTTKMYGLLESAAISYGFAMVTYTGQNIGKGDWKRVRAGMRASLVISLMTSCVISTVIFLFGKNLLGLFMDTGTEDGQAALQTGYQFLKIMAVYLPVLYILHITRSCIQGMGNTVIPMISGVSEFLMRTASALLLPVLVGETGVLYAEVIAWIGADLILVPGYFLLSSIVICITMWDFWLGTV